MHGNQGSRGQLECRSWNSELVSNIVSGSQRLKLMLWWGNWEIMWLVAQNSKGTGRSFYFWQDKEGGSYETRYEEGLVYTQSMWMPSLPSCQWEVGRHRGGRLQTMKKLSFLNRILLGSLTIYMAKSVQCLQEIKCLSVEDMRRPVKTSSKTNENQKVMDKNNLSK